MSPALHKILIQEFNFYNVPISESKVRQYGEALNDLSIDIFSEAARKLRLEPGRRFMPMPGDYLAAIPDGRLSVNEAWAMVPRDEYKSAVVTEETLTALGVARSLMTGLPGDNPFFTFKEVYEREVAEARRLRKPVKWIMSPGRDAGDRQRALIEAVQAKRIPLRRAVETEPEIEFHPSYNRLATAEGLPRLEYKKDPLVQIEKMKQAIKIKTLGPSPEEKK